MRADALGLAVRDEELRRHDLLHLAVLRVLHQADDLDVELRAVALAHALADGVAPQVELLRERFVDDGDLRRRLSRRRA